MPAGPIALRGLWGSLFSRKGGPAMTRPLRRGLFNRIALMAAPPVAPAVVTTVALRARVLELRGDWR